MLLKLKVEKNFLGLLYDGNTVKIIVSLRPYLRSP